MNRTRRLLIILISAGTGTLLALWILKKRMGNLKSADYIQLGFNFLFAVAIVIGISLFFQYLNVKEGREKKDQERK